MDEVLAPKGGRVPTSGALRVASVLPGRARCTAAKIAAMTGL